MLRIKLIKSPIGQTGHNRKIVAALGLRKMHRPKLHDDTPTIRGMIHHVKHMLSVEVVEGEVPAKTARAAKAVKVEKPKYVTAEKSEAKPKAAPKAAAKPVAEKAPKAEKPKAAAEKPKAKPAPKKATAKDTKE
jgi:large subunit ribosomal protein L30